MDQSDSDGVCSVCSEEVKGGFKVEAGDAPGVDFMIEIVRTPDNDHIVCDACNDVVHFKCLNHPHTGYCDRCFDKYGLEDVNDAFPLSGLAQ
jgi:hypothetical protein